MAEETINFPMMSEDTHESKETHLSNKTCLMMEAAVKSGDIEIVRQLAPEYKRFRQDRLVSEKLDYLLRQAIQFLYVDIAEILINAGADVLFVSSDGQRPLHIAAKIGDTPMVDLLVRSGSLLNAVDRNGSSALHFSALSGHRNASLRLIQAGATVNRPRRYDSGEAPVHAIARTGDSMVMKAAVEHAGGRPDLGNSAGVTPLHIASCERHSGCVAVLCDASRSEAAVNIADSGGMTPLHGAVFTAAVDCVRILLQRGAHVNSVDRDGLTPLHYAAAATPTVTASVSHAEVVDLLLTFGADVSRGDSHLRTPLHVASAVGNASLVRRLLLAGADKDAVDKVIGETALNIAAACGRREVLRELVEQGCDVNIADKNGNTPLHKLLSSTTNVDSFKFDCIDELLSHGAFVNVIDSQGTSPLQTCVFHGIIARRSFDGLSVLRRLVSAGALLECCHSQSSSSLSADGNSSISRRRTIRNSPLCWLTRHGELTAAAFLINAGWRLSDELWWISLPGKTPLMEEFLVSVRKIASNPSALQPLCRAIVRKQLQLTCGDKDLVPIVERLPLPRQMHRYLNFDTECDTLN